MNHQRRRMAVAAAAALVICTASGSLPGQTSKRTISDADRVAVRGDLIISSLTVDRLGLNPDGSHRVRFNVNVQFVCAVLTASSGAFKVKAEYRDGLRSFSRLGEADATGISAGGASRVRPTRTVSFETAVAAGVTRTFRATIDSTFMVTETNEYNNQSTKTYTADGCAGVDLVLTQVEVSRTGGGAVVHVWVRNRCLEPCVGNVEYVIDPSECLPGAMGVAQVIGARFEGETRYGPLGNVVAPGREGAELIYTVSLRITGAGCPDSDASNNSGRVVLPAGETRRVFYLR